MEGPDPLRRVVPPLMLPKSGGAPPNDRGPRGLLRWHELGRAMLRIGPHDFCTSAIEASIHEKRRWGCGANVREGGEGGGWEPQALLHSCDSGFAMRAGTLRTFRD